MKNITATLFLLITVFTFFSCEKLNSDISPSKATHNEWALTGTTEQTHVYGTSRITQDTNLSESTNYFLSPIFAETTPEEGKFTFTSNYTVNENEFSIEHFGITFFNDTSDTDIFEYFITNDDVLSGELEIKKLDTSSIVIAELILTDSTIIHLRHGLISNNFFNQANAYYFSGHHLMQFGYTTYYGPKHPALGEAQRWRGITDGGELAYSGQQSTKNFDTKLFWTERLAFFYLKDRYNHSQHYYDCENTFNGTNHCFNF